MTYRHCSVIDEDGRYIIYVLVVDDEVQNYTLAEDEHLIDANPPACKQQIGDAGFIVPAWDENTGSWKESATDEEIVEWNNSHPASEIPEPAPSTEEVLLEIAADHEERLCMMELGI